MALLFVSLRLFSRRVSREDDDDLLTQCPASRGTLVDIKIPSRGLTTVGRGIDQMWLVHTRDKDIQFVANLRGHDRFFVFATPPSIGVDCTKKNYQAQVSAYAEVMIPKGSLIHAYSRVTHRDDLWGDSEHPSDQFWAERHIKYVEKKGETGKLRRRKEFVMAACPAYFLPFGGGVPMYPGSQFAKYEMFTMLAILVDRFEMEYVRWSNSDGSPSGRPAMSDQRFSGIGSLLPDRDMVVRWKRIW